MGCERVIVYLSILLLFILYSLFEIAAPILFPGNFLDSARHIYYGIYGFAFGYQWIYLLVKLKEIHQNRMNLESFNSTKAFSDIAEAILEKKLKLFTRILIYVTTIWSTTIFVYGIGSVIQMAVEYILTGEVEAIIIVAFFPIPIWGQLIIAILNLVTIHVALAQSIAMFIISGLLTLEIETQCEVLCAAMERDTEEGSMFRGCIEDHTLIIKNAVWLIKLLESLNAPAIYSTYFLIALEMLMLRLVEAEGVYYFAVATDFLSTLIQLGAQAWFSSTITYSLQSISYGAYGTKWYEQNKNYALDVMIVTQMAQRSYVQKIFFKTIKIERATLLQIVRSSYSVYTILMVLQ